MDQNRATMQASQEVQPGTKLTKTRKKNTAVQKQP